MNMLLLAVHKCSMQHATTFETFHKTNMLMRAIDNSSGILCLLTALHSRKMRSPWKVWSRRQLLLGPWSCKAPPHVCVQASAGLSAPFQTCESHTNLMQRLCVAYSLWQKERPWKVPRCHVNCQTSFLWLCCGQQFLTHNHSQRTTQTIKVCQKIWNVYEGSVCADLLTEQRRSLRCCYKNMYVLQ